jgi:hypothetical protein
MSTYHKPGQGRAGESQGTVARGIAIRASFGRSHGMVAEYDVGVALVYIVQYALLSPVSPPSAALDMV